MQTLLVLCNAHQLQKRMETRTKTFKKRKWCRDAAHWCTKYWNKAHVGMLLTGIQSTENKVHVGIDPVIKVVRWNHTAIPGPTSVNQTAILYISSSQLLTLQTSYWCRARNCCMVSFHYFNDRIDPYMHLVSVLCVPVSSIPTCALFQYFVYQWAASLHHFLFLKVFVLVIVLPFMLVRHEALILLIVAKFSHPLHLTWLQGVAVE